MIITIFLDYFYGEAKKHKSYIQCMHRHIEEINQRLTTSFVTYEKAQLRANMVHADYEDVLAKGKRAAIFDKGGFDRLNLSTNTTRDVMEMMILEQDNAFSWNTLIPYGTGKEFF